MPFADPKAKAEYDRRRRHEKAAELRAYDRERNRVRRANPEYQAEQLARKRAWREKNSERHRATSRVYDARKWLAAAAVAQVLAKAAQSGAT